MKKPPVLLLVLALVSATLSASTNPLESALPNTLLEENDHSDSHSNPETEIHVFQPSYGTGQAFPGEAGEDPSANLKLFLEKIQLGLPLTGGISSLVLFNSLKSLNQCFSAGGEPQTLNLNSSFSLPTLMFIGLTLRLLGSGAFILSGSERTALLFYLYTITAGISIASDGLLLSRFSELSSLYPSDFPFIATLSCLDLMIHGVFCVCLANKLVHCLGRARFASN